MIPGLGKLSQQSCEFENTLPQKRRRGRGEGGGGTSKEKIEDWELYPEAWLWHSKSNVADILCNCCVPLFTCM